jgi:SAM-dependent methyltransferase
VKPASHETGVTRRFRGEATRWDAIYSEDTGWIPALWDRLTRANVRRRFDRTFEVAGDLRGKTVLDLGCGSGRYLIEAVSRGAARAVGVDVAPEMLSVARTLADRTTGSDRIQLLHGDLLALKLSERFDWVIANGLFDYVEDTSLGMRRAAEWSRGGVVATFPDRRAPRALPRRLYWRTRGVHIRLFEPAQVLALAAASGLSESRIERIGPIFLMVGRVHSDSSLLEVPRESMIPA